MVGQMTHSTVLEESLAAFRGPGAYGHLPRGPTQPSWQKFWSSCLGSLVAPGSNCVCASGTGSARQVPCFLWAYRSFPGLSMASKVRFSRLWEPSYRHEGNN